MGNREKESGVHSLGKGHVYWGMTLEEALRKEEIRPDIILKSGNEPEDRMYFTHRHLPDVDIYFVNNHSKNVFSDSIHLRTDRRYAEYWDPVSGECYSLPAILGENSLSLRLSLAARESGFIIVSDRKMMLCLREDLQQIKQGSILLTEIGKFTLIQDGADRARWFLHN